MKLPQNLRQFVIKKDRSCAEVFLFLKANGESIDAIESLLEEMKFAGLLNDEKFAENRISYRIRISKWGDEKIRNELEALGIDKRIITGKMEDISIEDWVMVARKSLQQLMIKDTAGEEWKNKAINKLVNKGFSEGVTEKVLRVLAEN